MTSGKWRKSSRSGANSPNCVEVRLAGPVELRDSKAPQLGTLNMPADDWQRFLSLVRR